MEEYIEHYGTPRHSGRYPWGSGENPYQRTQSFLSRVNDLHKSGMTEKQIADSLGISTTELRARKAIAKNEKRKYEEERVVKLKQKGYSNMEIGRQLGMNESSVRALLNEGMKARNDILKTTANTLKEAVDKEGYIDVGLGVERHLGISKEKLATAVAMLKEEGYTLHYVKVEQLGTGKSTSIKVLAPPGTTYSEVYKARGEIKPALYYSEDGGKSFVSIKPPVSVDSKRIKVRYGDEGGKDKDGIIELRRGVDDLSLGGSRYAQVRVAVDGSHYLKGVAIYSDNMPEGVDIVFNTNKKSTGNKLDAMKKMHDDPDNPFKASIKRQKEYIGSDGKKKLSPLNIVNEEGDWDSWGESLSSQMLSKQPPTLAKKQLDLATARRQKAYDEISQLTNPAVKKKLLEAFADECDSAAVNLRAASMPRQRTHVLIPLPKIKENEIYAPNYRNGESVVLIRYPHGGIFEIPELKVNNKDPKGRSILGQAIDAVGIHPKVAERLSGADFDGDTVLVIPNNKKQIKTSPALEGLKNFDPKASYPKVEGMKVMTDRMTGIEMGKITNLITDMTIKGASHSEITRAVRHSMVVIDAAKHELDFKRSEADNGIAALKQKYQGKANAGASTIISRASSVERVPERVPRHMMYGGPIDPKTGRKVFQETGRTYFKDGVEKPHLTKTTKMYEVSDAHKLSSGTQIESIYADYANSAKALANKARKETLSIKPIPYSPSAKKVYSEEVDSLKSKLNTALKNAPIERRAQTLANSIVSEKRRDNPSLDSDDIKKIKTQALNEARLRTGAKKQLVEFTPKEWEAIQAGAISNSMLMKLLDNANLDQVKQLATPRKETPLLPTTASRAKAMLDRGYTRAEVADSLGVSVSTLYRALNGGASDE